MKIFKWVALCIFGILFFSCIGVRGLYQGSTFNFDQVESTFQANSREESDNFYFVHLTDTHIINKLFDPDESTKNRLKTVIETVTSFDEKPAFIVITGDLVEWGGFGLSGVLNCQAFVECFYEKDDYLYADAEFSIPVYTTPGNHDYINDKNLENYHTYIDKNHIVEEDRYIIAYGDVSLFFMDSGPIYVDDPFDWVDVMGDGLYDDDIEWLEDVLSSCTSQHKIILMHHPAINDRNIGGEMYDVLARNREEFVSLCEFYEVDLVLAGHTHRSVIFDRYENKSYVPPLNCNVNPPFFVQSDDCKQGIYFRNISYDGYGLWIEGSVKVYDFIGVLETINSNLENAETAMSKVVTLKNNR